MRLKESKKKYMELYYFAPVGYLTLDDKEIIIEINLEAASLLKTSPHTLIQKPFTQFLTPDSCDKFHEHLNKKITEQHCELKVVCIDKTVINVDMKTFHTQEMGKKYLVIAIIRLSKTKKK